MRSDEDQKSDGGPPMRPSFGGAGTAMSWLKAALVLLMLAAAASGVALIELPNEDARRPKIERIVLTPGAGPGAARPVLGQTRGGGAHIVLPPPCQAGDLGRPDDDDDCDDDRDEDEADLDEHEDDRDEDEADLDEHEDAEGEDD